MAEITQDCRKELETNVQAELGLPSAAAAKRTVDAVFSGITGILTANIKSEGFSFRTPLGTFKASFKKAGVSRNPKTGEKVATEAKYKIVLKIAKPIQDAGK